MLAGVSNENILNLSASKGAIKIENIDHVTMLMPQLAIAGHGIGGFSRALDSVAYKRKTGIASQS